MIRHIFKILWNERKTNFWLLIEYILIFCILWFCCDYIYSITKAYLSPIGFDIRDTYIVEMSEKPHDEKISRDEHYTMAMTALERIKRHPDVESVTLADAGLPYTGSISIDGVVVNGDSMRTSSRRREVTSEFFDVYKIKLEKGRIFNWQDHAESNNVIISPYKDGYFGDWENDKHAYPITGIDSLKYSYGRSDHLSVIGITDKKKDYFWYPYQNNTISPLKRKNVNLTYCDIAIRVKPGTTAGFPERFIKDMREQLYIGPYFLSAVISTEENVKILNENYGIKGDINSVNAITAFLIVNIFLGILGSFWFRTQSRRNDIGLRMALGASRRNVQTMYISETLLLLSIASILATIICLHFGNSDLIIKIGIPRIEREEWGIGYEQDIINFALTFVFLAIVSLVAVWYPARQAANTQPAEVLSSE